MPEAKEELDFTQLPYFIALEKIYAMSKEIGAAGEYTIGLFLVCIYQLAITDIVEFKRLIKEAILAVHKNQPFENIEELLEGL